MVSQKNEANIMVKNAIDVIFGGISYWLFGYAFSFGDETRSNPFSGIGYFATDATDDKMGEIFSKYIFQLSFATTATTIVSGAMAERTNLKAYMVYSFLNTLSYCFPSHWIWSKNGFLRTLGAIDIAGCAPVHIVGGVSALVATLMLKPRHGRFDNNAENTSGMASPTNVMLGAFMLWWGWLGFNTGSTFGISGHKWKLASRAAVITINGSSGGAMYGIFHSYVLNRKTKGKLNIPILVTGLLGGLVGVTAICAICRPWEALVIGLIGGIVAVAGNDLISYIGIDDPVGCISVHFFAGVWGMIAVAFFAEKETMERLSYQYGITKGGGASLLGAQVAAIFAIVGWAALTTLIILYCIARTIGLRVPLEEELLGADWCEHGIKSDYNYDEKHTLGKRHSTSSRKSHKEENKVIRSFSNQSFNMIEENEIDNDSKACSEQEQHGYEDKSRQTTGKRRNSQKQDTSNVESTRGCLGWPKAKKTTIETIDTTVSITHSTVKFMEH